MTTQIPKYLLAIFVFLLHYASFAQQIQTIAFYNVENLFDTIDGPNDDAEFLPSAESKWDAPKYEAKLVHIRQVMAELNMPMVLGVCEIENRTVLDLNVWAVAGPAVCITLLALAVTVIGDRMFEVLTDRTAAR
jgi:hypothetical protein